MSSWIELPCGCRINDAFVLGMCPQHVCELSQKKSKAERDYRRFEEMCRSALTQTCSEEPK